MEIGAKISFSRQYKPSTVAKAFKTRFTTVSGVRVDLATMQVIDGKTGAWKVFAKLLDE